MCARAGSSLSKPVSLRLMLLSSNRAMRSATASKHRESSTTATEHGAPSTIATASATGQGNRFKAPSRWQEPVLSTFEELFNDAIAEVYDALQRTPLQSRQGTIGFSRLLSAVRRTYRGLLRTAVAEPPAAQTAGKVGEAYSQLLDKLRIDCSEEVVVIGDEQIHALLQAHLEEFKWEMIEDSVAEVLQTARQERVDAIARGDGCIARLKDLKYGSATDYEPTKRQRRY